MLNDVHISKVHIYQPVMARLVIDRELQLYLVVSEDAINATPTQEFPKQKLIYIIISVLQYAKIQNQ